MAAIKVKASGKSLSELRGKVMEVTGRHRAADSLEKYPPMMKTGQVCEALQINRKTLYKLIEQGKIVGVISGRGYKVSKENVRAYMNGERQ